MPLKTTLLTSNLKVNERAIMQTGCNQPLSNGFRNRTCGITHYSDDKQWERLFQWKAYVIQRFNRMESRKFPWSHIDPTSTKIVMQCAISVIYCRCYGEKRMISQKWYYCVQYGYIKPHLFQPTRVSFDLVYAIVLQRRVAGPSSHVNQWLERFSQRFQTK